MGPFFAFLFLAIGLLAGYMSLFLLFLILLPTAFLLSRRQWKTLCWGFVLLLAGLLLSFFLPRGQTEPINGLFFVVERKDSYCILLSWQGRYLLYDSKYDLTLFSIVRIIGEGRPFGFSHFEQQFDFEAYLNTKGVYLLLDPDSKELLFRSPFDLRPLKEYAFSHLDKDCRLLADSLLFGASLYDLEHYPVLNSLGLTSSMALGGFHLSFLLAMANKILGKKNKKIYPMVDLSIVTLFLVFSSFRYAIRRIFLTRLFHLINGKRKTPFSSLAILSFVAIFMLLLEPFSILSPAFYYAFPFLFTLRLFPSKREGKWNYLQFFIILTLFFLPMRLDSTYVFSLLSPFFQLAIMPLSHLIFLLSFTCFLLPHMGFAVSLLSRFLFFSAEKVHTVSPVFVSGKLSFALYFAFYLLLFLALTFRAYHRRKPFMAFLAASVTLLSSSFLPDFRPHQSLYFIDVDQGDCTLVRNGRGNILIDTGGSKRDDIANDCLIPFLHSLKITRLDAVIITHYDWDHYGALQDLKDSFCIDAVYDAQDFLEADNHTLPIIGLEIQNFNRYGDGMDSNGQSGVYSFALSGKKILIMGDAPKEIEESILEDHPDLRADILRIGHHGSATSSSEAFLSSLSPEVAIISVGEQNSYGHPAQETLATLAKLDIPVRRTDIEGTIHYVFS